MRNSCTNNWYSDQVFLCIFNTFFDCLRYFKCFSTSKSYVTISVSNNNNCCKAETSSTFYYFSYTFNCFISFFLFYFTLFIIILIFNLFFFTILLILYI